MYVTTYIFDSSIKKINFRIVITYFMLFFAIVKYHHE